MLLKADESQVLIVDIQGRLMPAMQDSEHVVERSAIVIQAAHRLGIPVAASRQYPKGLGPLVPEIEALVDEGETFDKTAFSCAADAAIAEHVDALGRKQIVICGVETHVCVLQTAFGFAARGLSPYVVVDACSSRTVANKIAAAERMRAGGINIVTSEMVCFEWMGAAGTDAFKEISKLIK